MSHTLESLSLSDVRLVYLSIPHSQIDEFVVCKTCPFESYILFESYIRQRQTLECVAHTRLFES